MAINNIQQWFDNSWPNLPFNLTSAFTKLKPAGVFWPKITVVTPASNENEDLEATILSVINQEYPNLEYIVGSNAENQDLLLKYQNVSATSLANLNQGFNQATGTLITWVKSGEMLAPGALFMAALTYLKEKCDVIGGIAIGHQDQNITWLKKSVFNEEYLNLESGEHLGQLWERNSKYRQDKLIFTRTAWEKIGGKIDESLEYNLDYELIVRFAVEGVIFKGMTWPLVCFQEVEQTEDIDKQYIEEIVRVREKYCDLKPSEEREQEIIRKVRNFLDSPNKKIMIISSAVNRFFYEKTEQDIQEYFKSRNFYLKLDNKDILPDIDIANFDCVIWLYTRQLELDLVKKIQEQGFRGLAITWSWDNHTDYNMNIQVAKGTDIFIPGHGFTEKIYRNNNSIIAKSIPLCTSQWTGEEAQEFFAIYGHKERSNKLFGGFTKYAHGEKRNVLLDQIIEQMPESQVFMFGVGNTSVYFDLTPAQRFEQWATYKVSICVPVKNDLPLRFFDALLSGQIPIVSEDIFDLDAVIPPYMQAMLPVIKFRNYDVESVQTAYQEAITRFDAEGIEGINRRHKFALENHLFVHRLDAILGMLNSWASKYKNYPTDISTLQKNIYLNRVDEKEIEIAPDDILCFVVERNESLRMPYFLQYYRSMGVDKFLIVDNDSTDDTRAYLAQQPDVYLWNSDRSFAVSKFGSHWVQLLLQNYGVNHWCLTIDADEFLYYPDCETKNLHQLCEELEQENKQALRGVLLDMYSDKPIKDTEYKSGQNPLEVCCYFDKKFYSRKQEKAGQGRHENSYWGGVRQRVFGIPEDNKGAFALHKAPLFKYNDSIKLCPGFHTLSNVKFSDQTGCLFHFKFFSSFYEYVRDSIERGEHVIDASEYRQYAKKFEGNSDLTLFSPEHSVKFKDSKQLLDLGVIINEKDWKSLGDVYLDQGNSEEAVKCYQKGIKSITEENNIIKTDWQLITLYLRKSIALELVGKIDEAIAAGKTSLEYLLKSHATIQDKELTKTGYQILITEWYGRTGNNLIQLAHALYIAETTQSEILTPPHELIKLHQRNYKFDLTDNQKLCREKLKGKFYYRSDSFKFKLSNQDYQRIFQQYLLKLIPFTPDNNLTKDTLVIHIRSGDILHEDSWVHPAYTQPPLIYYKKIIQDNDYQDIVIVTEKDKRNPCINALKEWLPSIKIQTGTFEEDISTILSAKNLVIGMGSFALVLAMMSQNINILYIPLFETSNYCKLINEESSDDLGGIEELKNISLDFNPVIYQLPEYIKKGEWRNTQAQRELMIAYPEEKIQVVESTRIGALKQKIATNPQQDIKVYIELGDALRQRGLWEEAIKYYLEAIKIKQHPAAYLGLGYAQKMQGNLEPAINCYEEAIKLNPHEPNLYIKLADVYLEKGEVEKAIANYEKALSLNYQAFWLYLKLGDIYKKLGDLEKATANYEKARENSPNEIWLYLKLARIYQQQGLIGKEEAFTKYKEAIELSNENSATYLSLAHFYFLQGELDEVVNSYYQILKKYKPAWVYQRLERALKLKEKYDDAKILMESAPVIQKQKQILAWLDVIICSSGGVGTSFFMDFVQEHKYINSPGDIDGLKHLDQPPIGKTKQNFKALYIFGDPLNAVVSLFRRNFQHPHSCKLLANYVDIEPIARYCSLEEYVDEGIDRLKLEQHFDNWSNAQVNYPIMLVKYETMWEHLPEIFYFLEIPASGIEELEKERKERESDWIKLPEETKEKLSAMYGKFSEKVANFEEIKIIEPQEQEEVKKERI
ncbi:MAG: tetratricopeptide repeat protein [Gomphosphaeria aponina SAG 52.96 = DSM 107014]|uniref:Tetratricopeptide repeat protein n=1 Tax=Gomphosphaeria aponina SAG 52.96 = DSM 107014 TaxID=1521640 RepID=A0A941GMR7_9CHRO|nr:tetratricopeptide repeat protein [Gomphosphaeria aponina SAG 52.96 = DSM 107014]